MSLREALKELTDEIELLPDPTLQRREVDTLIAWLRFATAQLRTFRLAGRGSR
jgi:hypothetical protein